MPASSPGVSIWRLAKAYTDSLAEAIPRNEKPWIGRSRKQLRALRAAQEATGVAAADFSRIRKANLGRFTIDRLMTILAGLGQGRTTASVDARLSF